MKILWLSFVSDMGFPQLCLITLHFLLPRESMNVQILQTFDYSSLNITLVFHFGPQLPFKVVVMSQSPARIRTQVKLRFKMSSEKHAHYQQMKQLSGIRFALHSVLHRTLNTQLQLKMTFLLFGIYTDE